MATITGSAGNDSLLGTAAADSILGLAGDDTLNGAAGADSMVGDVGNDLYIVDNFGDVCVEAFFGGTDRIQTALLDPLGVFSLVPHTYVEDLTFTGAVAALLRGNSLANDIRANSAVAVNDTLYGAAGNDTLWGFGGNDSLQGGMGADRLDGGTGADMMVGGNGDDFFLIDNAGDRAFEYQRGGFDTISSALVKDLRLPWTNAIEGLLYTGAPAATLHGNKLNNNIVSQSAANDTINGYDGNDSLDGGGGIDSLIGGLGNDWYFVTATDIVVENDDEGTDSVVGTRTSIASPGLATSMENLFFTGAGAVNLTGNGLDNIISGGSGNDTVSAAVGNDSIAGGAGADSLQGSTGDDDFYGGAVAAYGFGPGLFLPDVAVDRLIGGPGNDIYWIDALNDVVVEAAGAPGGTLDVIITSIDNALSRYANTEAMVLREGSDAHNARGGVNDDILVGNSGDNFIDGLAGDDTIAGHADSLGFTNGSDMLEGGAGNDVLVAFAFGSFYAQYHEITLFGGAGNDLYALGAGNMNGFYDLGFGGLDTGGIDTAVLFGDASLEALEGVDNIILFGAGGPLETQARDALDAVYAATHRGALYTTAIPPVYNAIGNELGNTITGNNNGNNLQGLSGDDSLLGGAGNDSLNGGDGADNLTGGAGNDWLYAETGDTVVEAPGEGFDIIASATFTTYTGFANTEGLQFLGANNVALNAGGGNVTNDFFGGGTGNDTLLGYGGNDTLTGGAGNDSIDGGVGADTVNGGDGLDTLLGGDANDSMAGGDDNDSMLGGIGADNMLGDDGNDTINGENDNDTLYGGTGSDALDGGDGNDQVYAGIYYYPGSETGPNTLHGGLGNDNVNGENGNDVLFGDGGNDVVVGNGGADVLYGGSQTAPASAFASNFDVLWGNTQYGTGSTDADQFRFDAPTAANHALETFGGSGVFNFAAGALVADFVSGSDSIRFDNTIVGDNDALLENVSVQAAPGAFSATAEMVIFRTDVAETFNYGSSPTYFAAADVISVIGSAAAAFAVGDERIFVVDNGDSSAIFQFTAANADAAVTVDELSLLAVIDGITTLASPDFALF